ncbi:hypothetical protein FisN_5Lh025 [Fistulifera solaris]|uniref:Uncharacterized protein n=1 Tax=Fistulifera solaris TaxID=1519565 RepID=A0A1Z5JJV3_FISSO|nr:hypothetical protein FisN_5Lh025 [Fistulifera solaris]|eukprot:GAX14051.1 hypothetical protein FisN_5Lh025 [Fistulifera solaris]
MRYTNTFIETQFLISVDKALARVKTILDTTRHPQLAHEDEDHKYDDKYALAEFLVNTSIAAKLNALERLGLDGEKLQQVLSWVYDDKQSVTLRLEAEDTCSYLKENIVSVRSNVEHEVETTVQRTSFLGLGGERTETISTKVVTKVKEHHWKVGVQHRLLIYKGSDPENCIELQARNVSTVIIIAAGQATGASPSQKPRSPLAERTSHRPIELNLTWMLQRISPKEQQCQFYIDRTKHSCKTPRRNENVDEAVQFEHELQLWTQRVSTYYLTRVQNGIQNRHKPASPTEDGTSNKGPDLGSITDETIFVPVIPLLEKGSVLSLGDVAAFLGEQNRSLQASIADTSKSFPPSQLMRLVSNLEATTYLLCKHLSTIVQQTVEGLDYVENMLEKQLVQAIGKEVDGKEFEEYIRYHHKKLFGDKYAPIPFTYAVRRPDHYPDGMLSIENVDSQIDPVYTWVRKMPDTGRTSMFVPINAATSVELRGGCFLHGWLQHRFESSPVEPLFQLAARARQFSSFLLIIGNIMGPNQLNPKNAIILQNKDELLIPLITNVLPSAKDFKDAIASLSPEQQDFANSFRSMQLESSIFGVCVIQLKPQLERLLGLPDDALTKEIQLTQDLMSLFVDYQIPSDLLSLQHASTTLPTDAEKVALVKEYVKAVTDVIAAEKKKQLDEETMKADMRTEMMHKQTGGHGDGVGQGEIYIRSEGKKVRRVRKLMAAPRMVQSDFTPEMAMSCIAPPPQSVPGESATTYDLMDVQVGADAEQKTPSSNLTNLSQGEAGVANDFTLIPRILDQKLEVLDKDNALHSTVIKAGDLWTRKRQQNLLVSPETYSLTSSDLDSEKTKAFDLLDAISRSGTLPIDCSELHVVIAVSHCFENTVMGTVVQDNINPILKVEKSSMLLASTVHAELPNKVLANEKEIARLKGAFPELMDA